MQNYNYIKRCFYYLAQLKNFYSFICIIYNIVIFLQKF